MIVEAIPYRTFKERIRIVKEEERKDRHIEIWDKYVYSSKKYKKEEIQWQETR